MLSVWDLLVTFYRTTMYIFKGVLFSFNLESVGNIKSVFPLHSYIEVNDMINLDKRTLQK